MRWVLVGVAAIIVWDGLVTVAWSTLHVESPITFLVDLTIYFGAAYQTTREVGTLRAGTIAGAVVAVAGQTAGLAVVLLLGPGIGPQSPSERALYVAALLLAGALVGAIVGQIAGLIARRRMAPSTGPSSE